MKKNNNLLITFFALLFVLALMCPLKVEAAPAAPTSMIFDGWGNDDFTGLYYRYYLKDYCDGIEEKVVSAATGKQLQFWSLSGGKGWKRMWDGNLPTDTVTMSSIRTFKYDYWGDKDYSNWSKPCIIIPWPDKSTVKVTRPSKKKKEVRVSWGKIKGSSCYNIAMTTNPNGKWYTVKTRISSNSTKISSYRGAKLKKKQNYYVRVITGKKWNGRYYFAPAPSYNYFSRAFRLT